MLLAFNRTIVELKQSLFRCPFAHGQPFNRTIVELKRLMTVEQAMTLMLLIEPLWN